MKTYYYEAAGQQAGPLSADELRAHGVQGNTLVWCENMPAWAPAASLPELMAFFQPVPPPLPARATGNLAVPTVDQLVPSPLAAVQGRAVLGSQMPSSSVSTPRPQFSAESSKYRWWHYLILAVAVVILMILGRACGAMVEQAVTVRNQALPTDNLTATVSTAEFNVAGLLSTISIA
jgi:hypothetical protein